MVCQTAQACFSCEAWAITTPLDTPKSQQARSRLERAAQFIKEARELAIEAIEYEMQ